MTQILLRHIDNLAAATADPGEQETPGWILLHDKPGDTWESLISVVYDSSLERDYDTAKGWADRTINAETGLIVTGWVDEPDATFRAKLAKREHRLRLGFVGDGNAGSVAIAGLTAREAEAALDRLDHPDSAIVVDTANVTYAMEIKAPDGGRIVSDTTVFPVRHITWLRNTVVEVPVA